MQHPRQILNRYGVSPKKSLGQNFLVEDSILQKIRDLAGLDRSDAVLEIGPGLGSLTRFLAESAGKIVAVEIDSRLVPILEDQLAGRDNVILVQGDILEVEIEDLIASPYKVVANVPYYITGAILRRLLVPIIKPSVMVLTVQREVADRLSASPGKMSVLSVSVQLHGSISEELVIRSGSFWPRPDVDSAVIRFNLRKSKFIEHEEEVGFMRLVKAGFSSKRKQVHNNLRSIESDRDRLRNSLALAGIDGTRRAQTLSIEEWVAIYQALL